MWNRELFEGAAWHQWWPLLLSLALVILLLRVMQAWMKRHAMKNRDAHLPRQMAMLLVYVLGLFLIILSLPVSETTRGQILSFLGLILTALIALSSTTLVSNAMAGLLLRIINSFRPGDFIRVDQYFGRVTERGLFHTEIQTEDRDLMTLPNIHLITTPVTVVLQEGTIVSAQLSLGYEVHHRQVEEALIQGAKAAKLEDPFVQVLELGDFSITYRVAGRLNDVSSILTARSDLRREVLDALHGQQIEIVSPSFMNQRPQEPGTVMIPELWAGRKKKAAGDAKMEDLVFDKAEQAGKQEQIRQELAEQQARLDKLNKQADAPAAEREDLERQIAALTDQLDAEKQKEKPKAKEDA